VNALSLNTGEPLDESLRQLFIAETSEQLEKFIEILLQLEKNPENHSEVIHQLFRLAHNVKGSAGMMGLKELKNIMHQTENMLDIVRKGKLNFDLEKIDLLLQFSDVVKDYVLGEKWDETSLLSPWREIFNYDQVQAQTPSPEERVEIALLLNEPEKQRIATWQEEGKSVYGIELQFATGSEMQGASALIFVKFIQEFGIIFKTVPEINNLKNGYFATFKIVLLTEKPLTYEQETKISIYPLYEAIEINIRKWVYRPDEGTIPLKIDRQYEQTIRVNAIKIDKLINDVGELLVVSSGFRQLFQQGYPERKKWERFTRVFQKLEQISGILQREVMDLRMIPVRQLFLRFPKIVRDIAKQKGKMVELVFFGEDTEIDKQIAEKIADALTHLIRNAVDHGLEGHDQRIASGKTDYGRITLGASQEGDFIILSVIDDGRGLNFEKIKAKAVKNCLIQSDQEPTEAELTKLIFYPGFSTIEQVSDISGRGVGLDVVQNSIKELKGDIEVDTKANQGTAFRLKLPLTLAVVQSFLVKIGGQIFGLPASEVVESLAVNPAHFHKFADKQIFTLRDEAIPVIDLHDFFNYRKPDVFEKTPLIIVKYGRLKIGLLVEDLIGQEEIIIKQINRALTENPLISGAALLGTGEIALILNVHEIIQRTIR
jgi:two-component system chemotaxis sensor kinase CheA